MKQPVFFISNPDRSPKFSLETRIWDNNGILVAEKRAATEIALPHLNQMIETYKLLGNIKTLKGILRIVPATQKESYVTFPYIYGKSAERLLLEAILGNQKDLATTIIDKMLGVIDVLPESQSKPSSNADYTSVFGKSYQDKTACTNIGLIDLNFDNVIISEDGAWNLIDYEWVFSFPIPKIFLIQRLFWWFVVRHQEIFSYNSAKVECVAIADNVLVPKVVFEKFSKYFKGLDRLFLAENRFQQYVLGHPAKPIAVSLYQDPQENPEYKPVGIERILLHEERANRMLNHIHKLEAKNAELEAERSRLRSNILFRIAHKLHKIFRG